MCFAGPSMGNSADVDQNVARCSITSGSSLLNEVYLYPKLINHWPHVLHA